MKYDIGDIVKIKKMNYNDYVIYQNRIGIIVEKIETAEGSCQNGLQRFCEPGLLPSAKPKSHANRPMRIR